MTLILKGVLCLLRVGYILGTGRSYMASKIEFRFLIHHCMSGCATFTRHIHHVGIILECGQTPDNSVPFMSILGYDLPSRMSFPPFRFTSFSNRSPTFRLTVTHALRPKKSQRSGTSRSRKKTRRSTGNGIFPEYHASKT